MLVGGVTAEESAKTGCAQRPLLSSNTRATRKMHRRFLTVRMVGLKYGTNGSRVPVLNTTVEFSKVSGMDVTYGEGYYLG